MKKFMQEFKAFALRGNVIDLAVGVIIGGAFQGIVKSLTGDILSPIIGLFAKTDFSTMAWTILGVEVRYGAFITAVINFLIMAFLIFLLVKGMNKLANLGHKRKEEAPPAEPTTKICPYCLSEISIQASRCPHCTSILTEAEPSIEEPAQV
jgi:large conductance mechanosensitive channel